MSVIKLEVPADNERALSAAAAFFAQLAGIKQTTTAQAVAAALPAEQQPEAPDAPADQDDSDDDTAEPSAPTIVNGVEVDSAGLPWDARIHAKTKTKNKDLTWKYAVGVDRKVLVPQVEAELRQSMNPVAPVAEPVQTAAPTPPAPGTVVTPRPAGDSAPTGQAAAPTPPAPAATNTAPVTFADAMKKYAAAKAKNVISDGQAAEFCQGKGLNGIASLSVCPGEIRGEFVAMVEALAAAAGVTL